jgi:hypothetical protein
MNIRYVIRVLLQDLTTKYVKDDGGFELVDDLDKAAKAINRASAVMLMDEAFKQEGLIAPYTAAGIIPVVIRRGEIVEGKHIEEFGSYYAFCGSELIQWPCLADGSGVDDSYAVVEFGEIQDDVHFFQCLTIAFGPEVMQDRMPEWWADMEQHNPTSHC